MTVRSERVVLYARVSSQHQAEQYGLKTQLDACNELAVRMGWEVVATYSDTISGVKITRNGLDQLREDIRLGRATAVVAYHLDRINRDPAHHYMFVREMKTAGARIYYSSKGGRPVAETDDDEFIEGIEALVAFRERNRIRTRTLDARRKKARDGELMGNGETPFGYERIGERGRYSWRIVEDEAQTVRQIFEWRAAGTGVHTIVRRLTESRTPTPSDLRGNRGNRKRGYAQWNNTTIYKILRNSSYAGRGRVFRQVVVGETETGGKRYGVRRPEEWFTFDCPAIVAPEVWSRVQQLMDVGKKQSPRRSRYNYLVGRRIRCDECKAAIVGRPSYKGTYLYYACGGLRRLAYTARTGCTLPTVQTHVVDTLVWNWVVDQLLDEAHLRERTLGSAADNNARERIESRLLAAAGAAADLDVERKRYQALYARGRMTDAEFDAQDDALTEQRRGLERELERLEAELAALADPAQLELNLETAEAYRELAADADSFEVRRGIIEDLDVQVVLHRNEDGRELWAEIVSQVFRIRDTLRVAALDGA